MKYRKPQEWELGMYGRGRQMINEVRQGLNELGDVSRRHFFC